MKSFAQKLATIAKATAAKYSSAAGIFWNSKPWYFRRRRNQGFPLRSLRSSVQNLFCSES